MSHFTSLLRAFSLSGSLLLCLTISLVNLSHADEYQRVDITELVAVAEQNTRDKQYDAALGNLKRAQTLIHVEDGVLSPLQNPILERMAIVHLAQGSFADANRMMELQHRIVGQSSNHSAEAMAPSWQTLGNWYQRTLQPRKSQNAYQTALSIIEQHGMPKGELAAIHLGMLKNEYLLVSCCDIETAMKNLENVNLSTEQWLELGDLAMLSGADKEARLFYRKSQATLPAAPIGIRRIDHMARSYVEATLERRSRMSIVSSAEMTPTQLVGAPLPFCESRIADIAGKRDYKDYSVSMKFLVTKKGKVKKVRMLESNAPGSINALVRDQLEGFTYRPKLVDGELATAQLDIAQRFDQTGVTEVKHPAGMQLGCVAAARALEQYPVYAAIQ